MGALAIARAIHSQLGIKAGVRWPNDVVVDGRKIAGVLVETKSKGNELTYTILGLGINANFETDKIDAIRNTATSLLTLHSGAIDREALICAVLLEIESLYESLCSDERDLVIGLLREVDWSRGKSVRVKLADREVLGIVDDF
jgi:BirA family biotin operon repressor/biotin-[acetyl-CoA-carboxylase] ligase